MTKLKSLIASLVVAVIGVCALVAPASAKNLDQAWMEELNKIVSAEQAISDDSDCLNLAYVGTSTQAVVNITATDITAYAPYNVLDTGNFGSALSNYDLDNASYDTMGELCTAIDALANYKCQLKGCKSDDNSALLRNQTATSGTNELQANGGFDVHVDTGGLAGDSAAGIVYILRVGINPAEGRSVRLKKATTNANVIGTFKVYGKLKKYENASDGVTRDDSTLVWNQITADDTDLNTDWTVSGNGGLDFAEGAHVVLSGGNGTGTQVAANYMIVLWEER